MNGRIVNSENYFENTLTSANTVEEDQRKKHKKRKIRTERFSREGSVSIAESRTNSYVSDFFLSEKFQSDVELLNDVPNQSFKNFLVRPKSSGARLYGIRPGNGTKRLDIFLMVVVLHLSIAHFISGLF